MIAWNQFIHNAFALYTDRDKITYCLGCTGQVVGRDKFVENQFRYYYDHGYKDQILSGLTANKNATVDEAWFLWSRNNMGKMCFDCSGLLDWCLGYYGQHKYSSWNFGDMPKQPSIQSGVAGSALWKKGHVEIDVGYGVVLGVGRWNDTIQITLIERRDFESSHLIKDVDYTGSNAR